MSANGGLFPPRAVLPSRVLDRCDELLSLQVCVAYRSLDEVVRLVHRETVLDSSMGASVEPLLQHHPIQPSSLTPQQHDSVHSATAISTSAPPMPIARWQ